MQLEHIPVEKLLPAPYNPRLTLSPGDAGWEKLERSLTEFELVQPIVWNRRTGHVVSGHQRLAIWRRRGHETAPTVVVDLPLEREKALNVALNNAAVGGEWDPEKLVTLVSELQDLPDFDATLTGFDDQQLRDLVLAPEPGLELDQGAAEPPVGKGLIEATLCIPTELWSDAEPLLDDLLQQVPGTRLHVSRE